MRCRVLFSAAFLLLALPVTSFAEFDKDLDNDTPPDEKTVVVTQPDPVVHTDPVVLTKPPVVIVPDPVVHADPLVTQKPAPYVEKGPRSLKEYLDTKTDPHYIRVDLKGHNVRTTPDFSPGKKDNIDFQTGGGDTYAVEPPVKPMQYGAAVQIHVDNELRWIYVPYEKKGDFQFCESEACFTAMADSLNFFLQGTGISANLAQTCGITAGPEGLILPKGAAAPKKEPDPVFIPVIDVQTPTKPAVASIPPVTTGAFDVKYRPVWESRVAKGKTFTNATMAALNKYGQGLFKTKSLGDAKHFCPNYSSLNDQQRKEFWLHMIAAISEPESTYREIYRPFDERVHGNVDSSTRINGNARPPQRYSMGLFALSYDYGHMGPYLPACAGISQRADQGKTVTDPSLTMYSLKNQTECAVGIMNSYVTRRQEIGYDRSPFKSKFSPAWSTVMSYNRATDKSVIPQLHKFAPCFQKGAL